MRSMYARVVRVGGRVQDPAQHCESDLKDAKPKRVGQDNVKVVRSRGDSTVRGLQREPRVPPKNQQRVDG